MARAVGLILASVLLASSVTGCGGKEFVSNNVKLETEKISIVEEESTEKKHKEESTAAKETKSKEPEVYSISSYQLANKTKEFFMEQAQQTFNSRYPTYLDPVTIGNMKSSNLNMMRYITYTYDEAYFVGLQDSYRVIEQGLRRVTLDNNDYTLTVKDVENTFNDNYRYYFNTDAVLDMLVQLTVTSSNPHDSRQGDITGEGYFWLQFVLNKGTMDDWRIQGIGYVGASQLELIDWDELSITNEDSAKIIENISEDVDYWRQVYIKEVVNLHDSNNKDATYSLIYVDDNEVPELLYDSGITGYGMCLYSFYDGQLTENWLELGGIYYIEKENKIYISDGRMGSYSDVVYKLNQGVLEIQDKGCYCDARDENNNLIDGYEYTWNDDSVTEEQYYNLVEQAFDKVKASVVNDCSKNEIIELLNSSEGINSFADYQTMYVVNCNESITMRIRPSTKEGGQICQIPLGATVSYIEPAENGFYKIAYHGNIGYALAAYLEFQ